MSMSVGQSFAGDEKVMPICLGGHLCGFGSQMAGQHDVVGNSLQEACDSSFDSESQIKQIRY